MREVIDEAGPRSLTPSRWFLVAKSEAVTRALDRSIQDTGTAEAALPLPHATVPGLATWEASTNAPLVALAGLLTELGCPEGDWLLGHAGAMRDTPIPAWLSLEHPDEGIRLTRAA
ncbi:MAG: hypothetical protein ACQEXJ_15585 [Myxococcota bacterium]